MTDGEVWVHSPFLMDGYFDDPDATRDALVDGWYRTGDLGATRRRGLRVDRRPGTRSDPHRR